MARHLGALGARLPARARHEERGGVALIRERLSTTRALVTAIALIALAKGLVWSALIPPWYGPDEASPYAYVQEIVENHWLARGHDPNAGLYYPHEFACAENNLDVGLLGAFHAEPPFGAPWIYCSSTSAADRRSTSPSN